MAKFITLIDEHEYAITFNIDNIVCIRPIVRDDNPIPATMVIDVSGKGYRIKNEFKKVLELLDN